MIWPTPVRFHPDEAALDVAAAILDRTLTEDVVERRQLALDLDVSQSDLEHGGQFVIRVLVAPGHEPDDALRAIDGVLARFRTQGPTQSAVRSVLHQFVTRIAFRQESIDGRAEAFAEYARLLGEPDGFARDAARYEALDPDAVRRVTNAWLAPARRVVAVVRAYRTMQGAGELVEYARTRESAPAFVDPREDAR
jgi:predicted Zn-dependent peptidase